MAFKRQLFPIEFSTGRRLTSDMVGIGIRFTENRSKEEPNIENTLIAASIEGMNGDYRVLSLLVDWIDVHLERVNIDRLTQIIRTLDHKSVQIFWVAIAQWKDNDWRLKKLQKVYKGPRYAPLKDRTKFQVQKYGEDDRFKNTVLRIPKKLLRHRLDDIDDPRQLAMRHKAYSYRVMIGPTYRADMWALLSQQSDLTPAELARRAYGSFPTAWKVRRDWMLLHQKRKSKAS